MFLRWGAWFCLWAVLGALLLVAPVRGAVVGGPYSITAGTYAGSAYMTTSTGAVTAYLEIVLVDGSTATAGTTLAVGCGGTWYPVYVFGGGSAAGSFVIAWPSASSCKPGVSNGSVTVAAGSYWQTHSTTPVPTPTPGPASVIVTGYTGEGQDLARLGVFVQMVTGGLVLFGLGVLAMGVWRRG